MGLVPQYIQVKYARVSSNRPWILFARTSHFLIVILKLVVGEQIFVQ